MKRFFKSGQKGFTLIELLVVVSILGVLAAVVILNVARFMGAGVNESALTELANVQTAVTAYMFDHTGAIPADMSAISAYCVGTPHGHYFIDSASGKVTLVDYP